jgi:hypothetical protein
MCDFIHFAIFGWDFWKFDPCVFAKIGKQLTIKEEQILNIFQ